MPLTIVSVGYPLAAVSPDSAGGAEQILSTLDRGLVAHGHRSIVVAPAGSQVHGELRPISARLGTLDDLAKTGAQAETRRVLEQVIAQEQVDLVHLHGIDFASYVPSPGVSVLATLHLPPDWYPPQALAPSRPDTWLNCVSEAQHALCPASSNLLAPIANGVAVEAFRASHAKRRFALYLGRICPEKGVHLAVQAARCAEIPLVIAGHVYPYAEHQRYFEEAIRPHLGAGCSFVGPVGFARKRRLLTTAHCLLVPSLAAETSSLVAREAAACGTAVIAFPKGAMAEAVDNGRTGFLVENVAAMAAAIARCDEIDSVVCRNTAQARFSDRRMIDAYLSLYQRLAKSHSRRTG